MFNIYPKHLESMFLAMIPHSNHCLYVSLGLFSNIMTRRQFFQNIKRMGLGATVINLMPGLALSNLNAKTGQASQDVDPTKGVPLKKLIDQQVHHGDGIFLNPFRNGLHGGFGRVMKWKLFSLNRFKEHYKDELVRPVTIDWQPVQDHDGLSVTFIKHSSILIKDHERYILIDPAYDDMFPLIKDFTPLDFDLTDMPRPDHILITHGHYDHLGKDTLARFDSKTHIVSPLGYEDIFSDLKMINRTRLDWLEAYENDGLKITLIPVNHWTMRNPLVGPNRSLWGGYVIETTQRQTIFISGDVAWFDHFEELGQMFDIDLAIFNLGAYEPRWFMKDSHMNPEEVAEAFVQIKARQLLIAHWGSYRLGDEPVHFPPMDIKREMDRRGLAKRLLHLDHGQTAYHQTNAFTLPV